MNRTQQLTIATMIIIVLLMSGCSLPKKTASGSEKPTYKESVKEAVDIALEKRLDYSIKIKEDDGTDKSNEDGIEDANIQQLSEVQKMLSTDRYIAGQGNTSLNLNNMGLVTEDETYIYFNKLIYSDINQIYAMSVPYEYSSKSGVYRMHKETGETDQLFEGVGFYLNVDDKNLYYIHNYDHFMYRYEFETQENKRLYAQSLNSSALVDNQLYSNINYKHLYVIDMDVKEANKVELMMPTYMIPMADNALAYYAFTGEVYEVNDDYTYTLYDEIKGTDPFSHNDVLYSIVGEKLEASDGSTIELPKDYQWFHLIDEGLIYGDTGDRVWFKEFSNKETIELHLNYNPDGIPICVNIVSNYIFYLDNGETFGIKLYDGK